MSLNGKKSCGHDNIRPNHLKQCVSSLKDPITHVLNTSIRSGIVPQKLKIAKVIPVYKKDERSDPSNYRPISLLSILDKILEKLICKRLVDFLEEHKLFYKYQFGFRSKHSTVQAVTEIVDNIIDEMKNGELVAGIYMDLSKAFDTVSLSQSISPLQLNTEEPPTVYPKKKPGTIKILRGRPQSREQPKKSHTPSKPKTSKRIHGY